MFPSALLPTGGFLSPCLAAKKTQMQPSPVVPSAGGMYRSSAASDYSSLDAAREGEEGVFYLLYLFPERRDEAALDIGIFYPTVPEPGTWIEEKHARMNLSALKGASWCLLLLPIIHFLTQEKAAE